MKRHASALNEAQRVLEDRLAALRPYIGDPRTNEIMINTSDQIFVEVAGVIERVDVTLDEYAIDAAIRAVMMLNSKDVGRIMDARLEGLRVAAALPPVAIHGPMMVIRKHARTRYRLSDYVDSGAFDILPSARSADGGDAAGAQGRAESSAAQGGDGLSAFLRWAIRSKKNILLCGGTSSGKTTLLASCLLEIPSDERIITCEDTNELVIEQPNKVQLEAAPQEGIGIRELIRLSLRSRPDRIIVGEIRGPEAYDLLDAMNTGHSGSLCTLHADSAFLGLRRLESLVRMAPAASNLPLRDLRSIVASAIHYVVHQSRYAGVRAPEEVIALDGVGPDGDYVWRRLYSRRGAA